MRVLLVIILFLFSNSLEATTFFDTTKSGSDQADKWWHDAQVGLTFVEYDQAYISLQTTTGYRFHKLIGVGAGLGYQQYYARSVFPLYATVRGYLRENTVSPFYYGDLGYGFATSNGEYSNDEVDGGLMYRVGFGMKFNGEVFDIILMLGYKYQKTSRYSPNNPGVFFLDDLQNQTGQWIERKHRSFEFRIGILF